MTELFLLEEAACKGEENARGREEHVDTLSMSENLNARVALEPRRSESSQGLRKEGETFVASQARTFSVV